MTEPQTRSDDWMRGYCNGLASVLRIMKAIRRPSPELEQVLLEMIAALKNPD